MAAVAVSTEDFNRSSALGTNPGQALESSVASSAKSGRLHELSKASISSERASSRKEPGKSKEDACALGADAIPVSSVQKKVLRAERFGISVQFSEEEKRNFRAERFGSGTSLNKSDGLNKSEELKRKERAERFGLHSTSLPSDEEAKKKARHVRFAPGSKTDSLEEDKRKARAMRFSVPPSISASQKNGEENILPKLAIVGKAE